MGKLKYLLIVLFILVFLKGFNQDDTDKSCFDSIAEKIINNRYEDAYSQINGFLLKKKTTFQKIELYYYPPLDNFLNNSIYKNKIFNTDFHGNIQTVKSRIRCPLKNKFFIFKPLIFYFCELVHCF